MAVQYGGRKEYDAIRAIVDKPPTPSAGISAMFAMGASQTDELVEETFDYLLNKARDQNLIYLIAGLRINRKYAKYAIKKFRENYDAVSLAGLSLPLQLAHTLNWQLYTRLSGNFGLAHIISVRIHSLFILFLSETDVLSTRMISSHQKPTMKRPLPSSRTRTPRSTTWPSSKVSHSVSILTRHQFIYGSTHSLRHHSRKGRMDRAINN